MRSAKRARADKSTRSFEDAGNAVNARGFDSFVKRHGRKDGRNALGEHGFPGAGRPEKENIVSAAASDFERAFGGSLAANIAQVYGILRGLAKNFTRVAMHGRERFGRIDEIDGLRKRAHGENVDAFDDGGFARVCLGHNDATDAAVARGDGRGKRSPNGA